MPARQYANLDLRVEGAGDEFAVRVTSSPAGEAGPLPVLLPHSLARIEMQLTRLEPWRLRTRGTAGAASLRDATEVAVQDIGTALFDALFHGVVRDALVGSRTRCPDGLRIRLDLTEAPRLAGLPWEMVYDKGSGQFLALSERTPVVRYLQLTTSPEPLEIAGAMRILAVLSSPDEFEPLDLDVEWERMRSALAEPIEAGVVTLDRLARPTLDELHRYLRTHEVHVLHLVGHGDLDVARNAGVFYAEEPDRRARAVSARELGPDLHDHDPLRLVVLNACQTASPGRVDVFSGLGQGLVRQWVPAVVAMQVPISDGAAIAFSHDFYTAIATGQPLDQALTGARKAIYVDYPEEWATPVLFMRAASGGLFTSPSDAARPDAVPSARLEIQLDGTFVGGDRAAATEAVFAALDQPVDRRSIAVAARPLDDAAYRIGFPDAYARLRRGVMTYEAALGRLLRGPVSYSTKWTIEQLVDAVLELRAICLPAQYDREDWYAWPADRPEEVLTVRLDVRWVSWFATGAFRWTPAGEPVDGVPADAPLWLAYVDPGLVWGRLVPALVARLVTQESSETVALDGWVISDRRPAELPRSTPVESGEVRESRWTWDL